MIAVNVAQLLLEPQGTARRLQFDESAEELEEPSLVERVSGDALLTRTARGVLADCRYAAALAGECARCLEPAITPVTGDFQEEYVTTVDVRTGAPIAGVDADDLTIDANHILDLGEAIRQHVLAAAPLQPLCRPDCRGLCAECGQELNAGSCRCAPGLDESPFAALRALVSPEQTEDPVRRG